VEVTEVFVKDGKRAEKTFLIDTDEGVRRDTTPEALAKLRPAFANGGVVTAGNSSQTSDGAAFTLVMSEEMVKQLNLTAHRPLGGLLGGGRGAAVHGHRPLRCHPQGAEASWLEAQ
jgi:acetyl-CoA acyltransferase